MQGLALESIHGHGVHDHHVFAFVGLALGHRGPLFAGGRVEAKVTVDVGVDALKNLAWHAPHGRLRLGSDSPRRAGRGWLTDKGRLAIARQERQCKKQ